MKKKIRFDNIVQVKYFNKDDIIKKKSGYLFYSRKIKSFIFFIIFCLFLYFYRT